MARFCITDLCYWNNYDIEKWVFLKTSMVQTKNNTLKRYMTWNRFFIPSLPRGGTYRGISHRAIYGRSFKGAGSLKQAGNREREKKNTSLREEPSLRIRVEYTAEGTRGFHWCTWMSRGHTQERSRRTCGRKYPYHPGVTGRLSRMLTACLWCR